LNIYRDSNKFVVTSWTNNAVVFASPFNNVSHSGISVQSGEWFWFQVFVSQPHTGHFVLELGTIVLFLGNLRVPISRPISKNFSQSALNCLRWPGLRLSM
jgi:hypothetical protein